MLLNYTNFSRAQFSVQRYCFFLIPQNIFEKKSKKNQNCPIDKAENLSKTRQDKSIEPARSMLDDTAITN